MKKENKLFIIYLFLIIVITSVSVAIIIDKNNEINKLRKSNKEIKKEYKMQIEQMSYYSWGCGE